jgi:hypothetical protein
LRELTLERLELGRDPRGPSEDTIASTAHASSVPRLRRADEGKPYRDHACGELRKGPFEILQKTKQGSFGARIAVVIFFCKIFFESSIFENRFLCFCLFNISIFIALGKFEQYSS